MAFNKDNFNEQLDTKNENMTKEDEEKLQFVKNRWEKMDEERNGFEDRWREKELQVDSPVVDRDDGKASVNLQIEQNIIEQKIGEKRNKIQYLLEPNGTADIQVLEPAKYTMDYFIKNEKVKREITTWEYEKGMYGTGFLFSGVWSEVRKYNAPIIETKKGEKSKPSDGFYSTTFEEQTETIWHIGIKNIDIWDFWVDETALTIEKAMDCILQERLPIEEFRTRFGKVDGFNYIFSVGIDTSENDSYFDKQNISDREVKMWHYWNKMTGEYDIIANEKWTIYNGKNIYANGDLPFAVAQEYPNTKCFYGKGVPDKTISSKPYLNNLYQLALDKIYLSSGSALLMGNNGTVDGELYIEPGGVAEWNFNGDVKNVNQMQFDSNTTGIQNIIQLMEDINIQNTGINSRAPFSSPGKTAFEAGLQEQAKNARLLVTDMLADFALDRALNMMLNNIMQFAPSLYAEKILDKNGTVMSIEFPNIVIPNVEVKNNKSKSKKTVFKKKTGEFGLFTLTPDEIRGNITLRLSTPTTRTLLQALEREQFTIYINNLLNIAQFKPEILQQLDGGELLERLNLINGFDTDKMKAATEATGRKKEVADIMTAIGQIGGGVPEEEAIIAPGSTGF